MQPITQANLDPKLNDIRHLRGEQSLDGVIDCFGPSILYRGTTRAPASMHVHRRAGKPKQLARNAKTPGETRVLQHGLQKANGEDRNRTTYKFPGKIALRYHARREIRRAPISLFETTRNTIHRDQPATSLQPDLQGHEFKTDPSLQGHRFPFIGSITGSHQKLLRIYRVTTD